MYSPHLTPAPHCPGKLLLLPSHKAFKQLHRKDLLLHASFLQSSLCAGHPTVTVNVTSHNCFQRCVCVVCWYRVNTLSIQTSNNLTSKATWAPFFFLVILIIGANTFKNGKMSSLDTFYNLSSKIRKLWWPSIVAAFKRIIYAQICRREKSVTTPCALYLKSVRKCVFFCGSGDWSILKIYA